VVKMGHEEVEKRMKRIRAREEFEKKLARDVLEGKATVKYFWGDW